MNDEGPGDLVVPSKPVWIKDCPKKSQTETPQRSDVAKRTKTDGSRTNGVALKINNPQALVLQTQCRVADCSEEKDIAGKQQQQGAARSQQGTSG